MSKNAQQDPTVAAVEAITRDVYLPAFVEKCASAGLQFPDESSLNAALESVAMLKAAEAAESTDLTKSARADLGRLLGEDQSQPVVTEDDMQKAAMVANSGSVRQAFAALAAASQQAE